MTEELQPLPIDWTRGLVLMAHPDDPEYGVAAAVARWVSEGKEIHYVLATRGEAGIAGMSPAKAGPLRADEQVRACQEVGVDELEFLDLPDGRIEYGLALRRLFAQVIRQHQPEFVITLNHRETWAPGAWNSADHQAVGRAVLDAVGDAANEWIFPDLVEEPWRGTRWVGVVSTQPTHNVEVTAHVAAAVASLSQHKEYLAALDSRPVAEQAEEVVAMGTPADEFGRRWVGLELFTV